MRTPRGQQGANPEPAATANIVLTCEQLAAAQADNHSASGMQEIGAESQPKFSLIPALVNMATPIDFKKSEGNKLNKASVTALPYKFGVRVSIYQHI